MPQNQCTASSSFYFNFLIVYDYFILIFPTLHRVKKIISDGNHPRDDSWIKCNSDCALRRNLGPTKGQWGFSFETENNARGGSIFKTIGTASPLELKASRGKHLSSRNHFLPYIKKRYPRAIYREHSL